MVSAAGCTGTNLIESWPSDKRAQLEAEVAEVPYHEGFLWRATRNEAQITLVGTMHLPDPRHQPTLDAVSDALNSAAALYVEIGPEEKTRLMEAMTDGSLLLIDEGDATLPERLAEDEWEAVSSAMAEHGFPTESTAVLRPWFVMLMLGLPPCMLNASAGSDGELEGLDSQLISKAEAVDLPIHSLEPWDTLFTLFSTLTPEQEEDMIRASIAGGAYTDDYAVTLTDAYFAGDIWQLWEFARMEAYSSENSSTDEVDAQFALAQDVLMDQRNQQWLEPLIAGAEGAAKKDKGIVAAFGSLHLPGEKGVLRLLEQEGWTIERWK
ncbi:hypothetical protein BJB45_13185 [Halomonas huangheensis]|uniref:TraB/GumN family protein n=1 Tax=Halomonas huangheensis TaxID=1178482 RepID=W1N7X0_9GAMM|nr:hypothetical protein AR456_13960 [Halomonas huangheensis]ERL51604.1 hypothetical protein BJB45_13185 [Halomonas huangheensis]